MIKILLTMMMSGIRAVVVIVVFVVVTAFGWRVLGCLMEGRCSRVCRHQWR